MNDALVDLRKTLHSFPELSGAERATSDRIIEFSKKHNPPTAILKNIGGYSLVLIYRYKEIGPSVMIRCELDALPIHEVNDISYRSTIPNVSHKCGHDGHMAIVCGLILRLKERQFEKGKVILFFQAAEENGQGARLALEDSRFKGLNPDYLFALHNIPGRPMHQVILQPNQFSPSVVSLKVDLLGKVAHASSPETGNNPALAIAAIVQYMNELSISDLQHIDFLLVTPVCISMGKPAYGIASGEGSVHYTMRAWSDERLHQVQKSIENAIAKMANDYSLEYEIEWLEYFPAAMNDPRANAILRSVVESTDYDVLEAKVPFRFGEDFGWLSKEWPCAMFGLGAGMSTPALHDEAYDFPDELIATGTTFFEKILISILSSS